MKQIALVLAVVCLSVLAHGQTGALAYGNITAESADCSIGAACVKSVLTQATGGAIITISGTYSATLQVEVEGLSGSGTPVWSSISAYPLSGGASVTSITGTGAWQVNVAGAIAIRIRCSSYSSGTAAVSIVPSTASASIGNPASVDGRAISPSLVTVGSTVILNNIPNDGATDVTSTLNALPSGHYLFPSGTYLINPDGDGGDSNTGGWAIKSNTIIECSPNTVFQAKTSSLTGYNIIRLDQVSNVTIKGCQVIGDRATHVGSTGEWGFGIGIWGATNVSLENVTISDCWGDGIYIMRVGSNRASSIYGKNVVSTNNRRQGMSIVDGSTIKFHSSQFINTNGAPPQAGIDIEPGGFGNAVSSVSCINCTFTGNSGRGFVAQATNLGDTTDVEVIGGQSYLNADNGIAASGNAQGMVVSSVNVHDNGAAGIYANNVPDGGMTVIGNTVTGNWSDVSTADGTSNIVIQGSTNVNVIDNVVRVGANANLPKYGIQFLASTGAVAKNNDLRNSGDLGDYNDFSGTGNISTANILTSGLSPAIGNEVDLTNGSETSKWYWTGSTWSMTTTNGRALYLAPVSDLYFGTFGSNPTWDLNTAGSLHPFVDNAVTIGISGAAPSNIFTYGMTIGGDLKFTSAPRMTWDVYVSGATALNGSTPNMAFFTPDKAIKITRLEGGSVVTPGGCTTTPQVSIYNGTSNIATLTIANSANYWDSGALAVAVAAGTKLEFRATRSSSGCTTQAQSVNFTVQYAMQ